MNINANTKFCMNNTKLCQELFANRFDIGFVMLHEYARGITVKFAVNPLNKKLVRFTYFDRMVHDALYTIYQDYLAQNPGVKSGCEINYQLLMKVMTGNPAQTNLKRASALRLILRDSLLKLAATDIYIDAMSLRPEDSSSLYIFFGKLVELREIIPDAEAAESSQWHDDRFVISGKMPLFEYAESVGRNNGQIVFYRANVMGHPVTAFPKGLNLKEGQQYMRKNDPDTHLRNAYRNTLNKMMIKHYMMHRIMVLKRGKCPDNFQIVNFFSAPKSKRNTGLQGMVPELFGTYLKMHTRHGERAPASSSGMIHHFSTDSEEARKKILAEVTEYTEALLCTWLYCHIEQKGFGGAAFFEKKSGNELCRKQDGKYLYYLTKLEKSKQPLKRGTYRVSFLMGEKTLCAGEFQYPADVRKTFCEAE